MKANSFLITLFFLTFSFYALAHKGGHHNQKMTTWKIDNKDVEASFLTFKDNQVVLETKTGEVIIKQLTSFSLENQKLIQQKIDLIKKINHSSTTTTKPTHINWNSNSSKILLSIIVIGLFFVTYYFIKRKKNIASAFLSFVIIAIIACNSETETDDSDDTDADDDISTTVPVNDLETLQDQFGYFADVTTSSDDTYFYVSSTGFPEHNMMVGITSWQQQVPIPQDYTGTNSWSIPLQPVLAETPLLASEHFMRGAMAIAVNGIPIFNPLNNRGDDAFVVGELDIWGGHCGKADDYHYHIPPTHLEETVGENQPIAYALDGFPIYGETTDELDEYLGKFNEDGSYQYHTTTTSPYFLAGMRGEVFLDPDTTAPEDQILPQAMSDPLRGGDYGPINGAEIVGFSATGTDSFSLEYTIEDETFYNNYSWDENGIFTFNYVGADGTIVTETYQR